MKVMVMIKGDGADEGRVAPSTDMLERMTRYNEELVKAGILLDGDGLKPTAAGVKVVFAASGDTSVVDGPFTESKEIIGGYWIWQVSSLEEAVEWAKRCPRDGFHGAATVLEIRPYAGDEDFGDALTPELREREAEMRRIQAAE
ncbi:YciI family protein [Catenuloplanes atrovinosus]|uniref:YCII-related domain-containing protein n=1 Tax=Catenuloplanes atrovinosus TaxID=137266 RepID=A0AAE3YJS1_9ACTN|nr:YciI family protein [Catenuloplanes atrovinosus]MDR7273654.1 hypothetical protein [Catenuloplanes atrovinosus]